MDHRRWRGLFALARDVDGPAFRRGAGTLVIRTVFTDSAMLIVLLCLDVGLFGPPSTGLELDRV